MVTKKKGKEGYKFHCEFCDYCCRDNYNLNKHLVTTKHIKKVKMITNGNKNIKKEGKVGIAKEQIAENVYICDKCGCEYKFRSGLSRHKKICLIKREKIKKSDDILEHPVVKELIKQNNGLMKQNNEIIKTMKTMIPKIGNNNNNNNNISINVFLNENCKDAMNIKDFVRTMNHTFKDLEEDTRLSISDILIKNLTDMDPTKRPIHCSDKKRLQFYIKDDGEWEKDVGNKKLGESVHNVQKDILTQCYLFGLQNNIITSSGKKNDIIMDAIHKYAWTGEETEKEKKAIIRKLAKATDVKNAINKVIF